MYNFTIFASPLKEDKILSSKDFSKSFIYIRDYTNLSIAEIRQVAQSLLTEEMPWKTIRAFKPKLTGLGSLALSLSKEE